VVSGFNVIVGVRWGQVHKGTLASKGAEVAVKERQEWLCEFGIKAWLCDMLRLKVMTHTPTGFSGARCVVVLVQDL
jgi:hypothetical protein